mmetsp:Transcript_11629/g.35516  ORF Transcript_11629/g.35516 Transcript_11629/m.35516 type:complete len:301 (-) Transcript_11629:37-939(-)
MAVVATTWQLNRHVDAVVAATMGNVVAATSRLTGSIWDGQVLGLMSNGTTEAEFKVECGMSDLCTAGEGHFIAACDDGSLRVIHMDGVLPLPSGHNDCATSIGMAAGQEKLVASGGLDAAVMLWDLDEPQKKPHRFEGHKDAVNSVEWVGNSLLTSSSDGTAVMWDLREKPWKPAMTINVGGIVYTASATASGSRIILSTEHCDISAYDARMGASSQIWRISTLAGPARRVRICPHSDSLCAAGTDSPSTIVFDTNSGTITSELFHHTDFVRGIAWNPETRGVLYSGSWDKTVSIINLQV